VEQLLIDRTIGPLQGFRSKMGRPFAALLKISRDEEIKNFKLEFDFGQNDGEGDNAEPVDFSQQTPLGPCPKCAAAVYEMSLAYVCENSMAKPKTCDFRSGRIILQQEISPEQMAKLLNQGKTDLLPGFVSQRTRRPFKAYLSRGADGKVSFEFEPRKPKEPKAGAVDGDNDALADGAQTVRAAANKKPVKVSAVKKAARKPAAKKIATNVVLAKKPAAKKAAVKKTVGRSLSTKKAAA
jgi:DNA topoisomerase-3